MQQRLGMVTHAAATGHDDVLQSLPGEYSKKPHALLQPPLHQPLVDPRHHRRVAADRGQRHARVVARPEPRVDRHEAFLYLGMQGVLRRVVHIISVPRARFLGLHVVRDDDVFPREGRPSTIHLADPVVAPPVLEGRGEERVEDLDVRFVHKGVRQNALVRRVQGTGYT